MKRYLIAAVLSMLAITARAQLVWGEHDVLDQATGLDWQYLVETISIEPPTGTRLATSSEVETFFEHVGFVPGSYAFQAPFESPTEAFMQLLDVWAGAVPWAVQGQSTVKEFITADGSSFGVGCLELGYAGVTVDGYYYAGFTMESQQLFAPFGLALIAAVPEPNTVMMMLLGMVLIAARKWLISL